MDIDIAQKLIPNLMTMAAQLAATFVIFLMYKKFLHTPVQAYLDARAQKMNDDLADAQALKLEGKALRDQARIAQQELFTKTKGLEEQMLLSAEKERKAIIDSAQDEILAQRAQNERQLKLEREAMELAARSQVLDLAVMINQKVLEEKEFDHSEVLKGLEKALETSHD